MLFADNGGAIAGAILLLVYLVAVVVLIAGMWKTFDKAGQPGWTALIPILNVWVEIKIAGKEWWWILLFLIPCVNLVAAVIVSIGVAERFGKSSAYGLGLAFLPFVFFPVLGFGDAEFQGTPDPVF